MRKPSQSKREKQLHSHAKASETNFQVNQETELMSFLLDKVSGKSRNQTKGLLARGQVLVNGEVETKYNYLLQNGDQVSIQWTIAAKLQEDQGLKIMYEDEHLLVVEKEAGLLSIATDKQKAGTAYSILTEHVRKQHPKNRIFVVHRLDRDTSGVMIYAKNEAAKRKLQENWAKTVVERKYVALVEGAVATKEGTITSWLKETKTLHIYSSPRPNGGQKAVTHYKRVKESANHSLLEVELETGRKNQIRVHMQDIGHSIVGDKKYGASKDPLRRLGLHALSIAFYHPMSGELMRFETQIPKQFLSLVR